VTSDAPAAGALRRDALAVLVTYAVLGVSCGLVWWLVWEPPLFVKVAGEGGSMGEVQLGRQFSGDGWYAVVAGAAGLLSGIAVTAWRSRDLLASTLLVVVGSLAAAAVMALVGNLLGPQDADAALAAAEAGARVPAELEVRAGVVYLVWPICTLVGALIVLWSPPSPRGSQDDEHADAIV